MARILITGGAGFIGSHLCERFLAEGDDVICMDNFLTGTPDNVAHLFADRRFSFIQQDVTTYIYVKGPLDAILHFASPASPVDYLELPIQTLKVGSLGTHKALGLAKEKGARFLLASTSEVYGDPLVHPQNEQYWGNVNPIGPRGVYDDGKQTRSFCYVTDLVEGIVRLLNSDYDDPVNLGNPREMTVLDFAKTIVRLTASASPIVHRPLPVDDPKVRQPDIRLARELLRWAPAVEVQDGLRTTID